MNHNDVVEIVREPPLAWLILNLPDKLNALTTDMWRLIPERLHMLERDADIRVILMRGAGDRAFSAGADITEFQRQLESRLESSIESGATERALTALGSCTKPTVGVIRGRCIGGGCAIVLALDIRLAATDATFGLTPARLGVGYPQSGVERAIRELGPAAARHLFITAKHIDAHRAYAIGLVQDLFEPDDLIREATALGTLIAANAPRSIRALREAARQSSLPSTSRDPERVQRLIRECFDSEDYREGVTAFIEKRPPNFRDR